MQKSRDREERARSAAQKAADELAASRRDHQQVHHEAPISPRGGGGGGGVLSGVQKAMERAKEYAVEKKEAARARRDLAGDDAVLWKGKTVESAWQQGQEKGRAAPENILEQAKGAMRGVFYDKMAMPTDVVEEKRAEAAGAACPAGIGNDGDRGPEEDEEEDDVMLRVKAADQR